LDIRGTGCCEEALGEDINEAVLTSGVGHGWLRLLAALATTEAAVLIHVLLHGSSPAHRSGKEGHRKATTQWVFHLDIPPFGTNLSQL
jgi:hypothetical protein